MIYREQVLTLMMNRDWKGLIEVLKDDKMFNQLFYNDIAFKDLFNTYFIKELLDDNIAKLDSVLLCALYNFHNQSSYKFRLSDKDYKVIAILYAKSIENPSLAFKVAKEFPDDSVCKEIIRKSRKHIRDLLRKEEIYNTLGAEFSVKKEEGDDVVGSSIFSSFEELDCFKAIEKVFPDYIIIPKAVLPVIIDSNVCNQLQKEYKKDFHELIVDFAIVERQNYRTKYIIQLYHGDDSFKDNINEIIRKSGIDSFIIQKEKGKENELAFIDVLNKIRVLL